MPTPQHDRTSVEQGSPEIDEPTLGRRRLLRGGAAFAGAAGVLALSTVTTKVAHAADGEAILLGRTSDARSSTTLRIGGGPGERESAALVLQNADGPSLQLQPLEAGWAGPLELGQIANTEIGPAIGVIDPSGSVTSSYLLTEFDLNALPLVSAIGPVRLVDTRDAARRGNIIATPTTNFDAAGRLRAGRTMTVAVAAADADFALPAAFVNVVSTESLNAGYLSIYPPGTRPPTSTVNFARGATVANGSFVALGLQDDHFAFTVYTNATAHVVVDMSGFVSTDEPGPAAASAKRAPGVRRSRAAKRRPKLIGRLR